MIGAIIGDIAGSRFEFNNYRKKDFLMFSPESFFTDDTVMSLAIAKAILNCNGNYGNLSHEAIVQMQSIGRHYPHCGYGGSFHRWIYEDNPKPYNSYGNGAAMRVSACGFVGNSIGEVKQLTKAVTEISHNHEEGLKGAEATAVLVYLARTGKTKDELREYVTEHYYPLNFTIDEIRPTYYFNETCQNTVPQAIEAFLEAESFEDAIRTAVSVGGDSDTLAAITGGIAEAYFGVPDEMREKAESYLDNRLLPILKEFENKV